MNVLLLGGTGLISRGIIKHLLARRAAVTMLNRNKRDNPFPPNTPVKQLTADRDDFPAFERLIAGLPRFDAVIDMICFRPDQAQSDLRAFAGRCDHFLFCSTVCTYGVKVPPNVLITEDFPQDPISDYGRNKLACEQLFHQAHEQRNLNVTTIRPSCTYGPGNPLIDQLEFNTPAWDRIEKGLPVLCAGDGLGLWQATHRDDVGRLFAHACLNPKTFGQSYNATRPHVLTWRDYYRQCAEALNTTANLVFMPANWIVNQDPKRFGLLKEITQFHGAYDSTKARRDVAEFDTDTIDLTQGAAETFADLKRRQKWTSCDGDAPYNNMIGTARDLGIFPTPA